MRFTPHITVACIITKEDRFLCVKEHIRTGIAINQPAGHLEANETLIEAAMRETLEETGWTIKVSELVGIYLYQAANGVTYQRVCFAAEPLQQQSGELDPDIIEPLWLTLDELEQHAALLRSPLVKQSIHDYLAGSRHPLSLLKGIYSA